MTATSCSEGRAEQGVDDQELDRMKAGEMDRDAGMVTDDTDRSKASDDLCGKIYR